MAVDTGLMERRSGALKLPPPLREATPALS